MIPSMLVIVASVWAFWIEPVHAQFIEPAGEISARIHGFEREIEHWRDQLIQEGVSTEGEFLRWRNEIQWIRGQVCPTCSIESTWQQLGRGLGEEFAEITVNFVSPAESRRYDRLAFPFKKPILKEELLPGDGRAIYRDGPAREDHASYRHLTCNALKLVHLWRMPTVNFQFLFTNIGREFLVIPSRNAGGKRSVQFDLQGSAGLMVDGVLLETETEVRKPSRWIFFKEGRCLGVDYFEGLCCTSVYNSLVGRPVPEEEHVPMKVAFAKDSPLPIKIEEDPLTGLYLLRADHQAVPCTSRFELDHLAEPFPWRDDFTVVQMDSIDDFNHHLYLDRLNLGNLSLEQGVLNRLTREAQKRVKTIVFQDFDSLNRWVDAGDQLKIWLPNLNNMILHQVQIDVNSPYFLKVSAYLRLNGIQFDIN